MARKGYAEEYFVKGRLIKEFGEENVIKVAIGGAADFLVLKPGENRIEKIVEVKGCHEKKYYPHKKYAHKYQFERMANLCDSHNIDCEVWVKFPYHNPVVVDIHQVIKGEPISRPVKEA